MPEEIVTKPFALDAKLFAWATFPAFLPRLLPLVAAVIVLGTMAMYTVIPNVWIAVAYVTVVSVASLMMHPLRTAKTLRKPANRKLMAERTLTFTPSEFRLTTVDGIDARVPLTQFISAALRRGLYLLELAPRQFYPVDVNAFRSDDDRVTFESWIKAAVPKVRGF